MRRRFNNGLFGDAETGNFNDEAGVEPMEGVANLADVMLVLACGIMLALIIHWDIDVSTESAESAAGEEIAEVESLSGEGAALDADAEYEEMGVVYRDAATGKLYMVTKDD
jgi:hypothetical protein